MKLLILFIYVSFSFAAHYKYNIHTEINKAWDEMVTPYKDVCIRESGIDKEVGENCVKNKKFPDTREFKCFAKCVWTH